MAWAGIRYSVTYLLVLAGIAALLVFFAIYFFRDPKRNSPDQPGAVVSPADGKVIAVDKFVESEFMEAESTRIVIFLSLFDVLISLKDLEDVIIYFPEVFNYDPSCNNQSQS